MSLNEAIPFIEEIKLHFGLEDGNYEEDALPINGHFVTMFSINGSEEPMLLLCTSLGELDSRHATQEFGEKLCQYKLKQGSDGTFDISMDPEYRFLVLQQNIFPDTADEACQSISAFTEEADRARKEIFSADVCEAYQRGGGIIMVGDFLQLVNGLALSLNLDAKDESCVSRTWMFDGREVGIGCSGESGLVVLDCLVKQLPAEQRYDALIEILLGSHLYSDTSGARLTLTPDNGVWLHLAWPMRRLEAASFEKLLENYLNVADYWQERLETAVDAYVESNPEENLLRRGFFIRV